jgi:lysophospholipase L1-like esterase
MVRAIDAPLNDDGLHLATEGQRLVGRRLADAMRNLRKRCR